MLGQYGAASVLTAERLRRALAACVWMLLANGIDSPGVAAQETSTAKPASGATVRGVIYDSVARARLADAIVQLVGADSVASFGRTAFADSAGAFAFTGIPDGEYRIGFHHAVLDSLGVEPPLRKVSVLGGRPVRVDLAVPSPEQLRVAVCGPVSPANSGALVMGVVRTAITRAPVAGVKVAGQWLELSFERGGLVRRTPMRVTTTREDGWFAICNAPRPGVMWLTASRGADSTDTIELQVSSDALVRRELYLGERRVVAATERGQRVDSGLRAETTMRVGGGRLEGMVVTALGAQPLAGALVAIAGGAAVRANARGQWTLTDVPTGTRTLEVRAVGYYPLRQAVDVIDGVAPIRVSLVTLKSVLDTVKVTAAALGTSNLMEFTARRRSSGAGRFLTAADIARRAPVVTSDIFRAIPGIVVEMGPDGEPRVMMRGAFAERCAPSMFVNGRLLIGLTIGDIETMTQPKDLIGIEVYASMNAPPQFAPALDGCGSIVFWTR